RHRADARPAAERARVALRRRAAARRGHAPVGTPRRRALRQGAAEPERRAASARGAVEVRIQGHQVDREDPPRRATAADDVEPRGPGRVRILRQREPGGGPSALEPSDRAPDRRFPAPADAPLQWLWRTGGLALRGDGPAALLLTRRRPYPWLE